MNFSNKNPFDHVFRELYSRFYDLYRYQIGKKNYLLPNPSYSPLSTPSYNQKSDSSIDSILSSDSEAVFDKAMNTVSTIFSRLMIHSYINQRLDYNSLKINNEILDLESSYSYRLRGSERRRSALTSEILGIERHRLDERVKCWQDLMQPMSYLVNTFHQYKELQQDRKLLEDK